MKPIKVISFSALVIVVVFIVLIVYVISLGPTSGAKIVRYESPQKALVVIDMQEDYTGTTAKPPFPYKNSESLITSVNALIQKAQHNKLLIVYIRQEFDGALGKWIANTFANGTAIKGAPGTEIDSRVSIVSTHIFGKPKGDSFSNPYFEKFLVENRVNELILVGLDAEFCVFHTAQGALNRDYRVTIVKDAIALRNESKWGKLLETYCRKGITLKTVSEVF